jgi:enamine deaminase RidA (YjgF/YER057c/UK114 family)
MAAIERLRLTENLPEPISHYTDAVRAGDWLYVSGMLALDKEGKLVGGAAINTVRRKFFGESRPASTLVEVSAFVLPQALVEIDAVAYLGG